MPRQCAVLLAAGEGKRLRPLTDEVPKALCPVGNEPLLDRALDAVAALGFVGPEAVAVNAWYHAGAIVDHVAAHPTGAYAGVERTPAPLGSAGGLAALRDWIDGRDVLVGNADAYLAGGDLTRLTIGSLGQRVRLLGVPAGDRPAEFGPLRFAGFTMIPWSRIAALPVESADLVSAVWRPAERDGQLDLVDYGGYYLDCGTPLDYLTANLDAADRDGTGDLVAPDARITGSVRHSVIGAGATVAGDVDGCVVWPGARVEAGEQLRSAIRWAGGTVRCGAPHATTATRTS